MKLVIATSQFPVDADIGRNERFITRQMRAAKQQGAHVIHFPECALSGYAGANFKSFKGFDWEQLEGSTRRIMALAKELKLWAIVGSSHRLTGNHKPHNSLFIINAAGEIVDRYDKMFVAGRHERDEELAFYTPGAHFTAFEIKGVRCGVIICHEFRYPELYRQYKKRGVQVMFHSYHAAKMSAETIHKQKNNIGTKNLKYNQFDTIPGITMPATMHSYAANNYMWISCSNSSAPVSCWPSFAVRPDGICVGRLRRNVAGLLITAIDTKEKFYDSTIAWRDRAMKGQFHSGTLVKDPRSENRKDL